MNREDKDPEIGTWVSYLRKEGIYFRDVIGKVSDVTEHSMTIADRKGGKRWSLKSAISRAYDLAADDAPWTGVVLLGTRVSLAWSRAIRCDQSLAFERITHREVDVVTIPHPSGRYTAWNKPGTFARAREVLAAGIPDVPWGELDKETP